MLEVRVEEIIELKISRQQNLAQTKGRCNKCIFDQRYYPQANINYLLVCIDIYSFFDAYNVIKANYQMHNYAISISS